MSHRINHIIKQVLATFRNVDKTILEGYVMLLYINAVQQCERSCYLCFIGKVKSQNGFAIITKANAWDVLQKFLEFQGELVRSSIFRGRSYSWSGVGQN